MSLVFDKSDKRTTIYDSYNVGLAAKFIKSVKTFQISLKFTALQMVKRRHGQFNTKKSVVQRICCLGL